MSGVSDQLARVRQELDDAARSAARDPAEIVLVAVSKKHPAEAIREAYAAGQRDFGENYAQELAEKQKQLADLPDLRWHFIGSLQSNKARLVVPGCALIHAVDRMSVLDALSRRALGADVTCDVLLEVNVAGEASKAGVAPDELPSLLERAGALSSIRVRGLMCIPPVVDNAELARPFFRRLRDLRDSVRERHAGVDLLSMGMTSDFPAAVAEGATHIRVGTAIFGARA